MPIRGMKRREFIAGLGGAAAWPVVARAQQPSRKVRIGVLLPSSPVSYSRRTNALLEGLRDLGYEEGKTVTIEWRWGNELVERLPELAAELVSVDVQAIITAGTPAAKALKNATRNIPIIMAVIGDPVATGLVDSLAHPGGNVTGFSILASDLSGKRLELLKEVVPRLSSVGVILNPANPQPKIELGETEVAARTLGVQIHPMQLSAESSLQNLFDNTLRDHSVQAVIVLTDAVLYNQRKQIVAVPIVFMGVIDPVGAGFVSSLAKPGGNTTGFIAFEYTIGAKWLELLKEIAPRVNSGGLSIGRLLRLLTRIRRIYEASATRAGAGLACWANCARASDGSHPRCASGPRIQSAGATDARPFPHDARCAIAARRCLDRRDDRDPVRCAAFHRQTDRITHDFRRPGRNSDRERALVR